MAYKPSLGICLCSLLIIFFMLFHLGMFWEKVGEISFVDPKRPLEVVAFKIAIFSFLFSSVVALFLFLLKPWTRKVAIGIFCYMTYVNLMPAIIGLNYIIIHRYKFTVKELEWPLFTLFSLFSGLSISSIIYLMSDDVKKKFEQA